MRILNLLLLTAICLSKKIKHTKKKLDRPEVQCVLAMRVYPYQFIEATRTVSLRLRFESNCQPYHQPLYLELPWQNGYDLTIKKHPKEMMFIIFDIMVNMKFYKPKKILKDQVRTINYTNVDISIGKSSLKKMDTTHINYYLIKNKENNFFMSKQELDDLWKIDYPYLCSVQQKNKYFVCDIKP